jgi:8-oxo-dGTP pyrophosphatase MutT (NUDIX family)
MVLLLIKEYDIKGVGLIIFKHTKILFTIAKETYWKVENDKVLIPYTSVGGRVEKGETLLDTAYREALEEIDTSIEILSSPKTFYINLNLKPREIQVHGEPKPLSIYYIKHQGKPGKPHAPGYFIAKIYVYLAKPRGEPRPSSEIPALLWSEWRHILDNLERPRPLPFYTKYGKIVESKPLPQGSHLYPTWTPEILGKSIGTTLTELLRLFRHT